MKRLAEINYCKQCPEFYTNYNEDKNGKLWCSRLNCELDNRGIVLGVHTKCPLLTMNDFKKLKNKITNISGQLEASKILIVDIIDNNKNLEVMQFLEATLKFHKQLDDIIGS